MLHPQLLTITPVYDTTDYNTANQIAIKNLQKPTIREEIARQTQSSSMTLEDVLRNLEELVSSGPGMNRLRAIHLFLKLWGVLEWPGSVA